MREADGEQVQVRADIDIVTARHRGREIARDIGMGLSEQTIVATAISELARNIITYGGGGEVSLHRLQDGDRVGLQVVATDHGQGIRNLDEALRDGFSTGHTLGLGLPGVRRLMDEFHLDSTPGAGTTVRATKWLK
ncbi:MAG: serine/threonine-protein kinase RsbT [Actinomycetota bacterium]|jgi:serine/threonine-protein kinase RsbT|nr:serine/threonine-protein kinase RsbT [Actinomycetota bacterium]